MKANFHKKFVRQFGRDDHFLLGDGGTITALVISAITLIFLFINPDYRPGVYGCALWFFCGIAYFYCWGRKTLVKAPEEEFALSRLTRE